MVVDFDNWCMQCLFLVSRLLEGNLVAHGTVQDCV